MLTYGKRASKIAAVLVAALVAVSAFTAPIGAELLRGGTATTGDAGAAADVVMHDATVYNGTDSTITVAYNATGLGEPASNYTLILQDSNGNTLDTNASLSSVEGTAELTVPAGLNEGDVNANVNLIDGTGSAVATDSATITVSRLKLSPWVDGTNRSYVPTTDSTIEIDFNATGQIDASDVIVQLQSDDSDSPYVDRRAPGTTEGTIAFPRSANSFESVTNFSVYLVNDSSSTTLSADSFTLKPPSAPWVNNTDVAHDPTTQTTLSVHYNATGQIGSASDVVVQVNDSTGTVVAANASLSSTEGVADVTVPAGTFSGDELVTYELVDGATNTILTSDVSALNDATGGSGLPPAAYVNNSDTTHDATTRTTLEVDYNATGKVGSASDITVQIENSTGNFVASNGSLTQTEGTALVTVTGGTLSGNESVTYQLIDTSSFTYLTTDTSWLNDSGGGGGGGGLPPAAYVNMSDRGHDPTTDTTLTVAYNATGQVASASDVVVQVNDSTGTVVAANASLSSTEGLADVTIPAGTFSGDELVTYELVDGATNTILTTDTSILADVSGGGGGSGLSVKSVNVSDGEVTPGQDFDLNVTLENTAGSSTTVETFVSAVATTDAGEELYNQSVTVNANSEQTITITRNFSRSGVQELFVGAGNAFDRTRVIVQPTNALQVDSYSVSSTTIDQNENVELTATVNNTGSSDDWQLVPVYHDGTVSHVENVSVAAGGEKTVTLTTTFGNTGSHTVAIGNTSSTSITVESRGSASVTNTDVEAVNGTQPTGTVVANTSVQNGRLTVHLEGASVTGDEKDLTNVGVDTSTEFEVTLTIANFTPRMMMGSGQNVSWTTSPGPNADETNLTITIQPVDAQRIVNADGSEPTLNNWPSGGNDQANVSRNAEVSLSVFSIKMAPVRFRTTMDGATIVTDAQRFSPPQLKQGTNDRKPRLSVNLAGPHLEVDGSQNDGRYEAIIPDGLLEMWGVGDAGQLRAAYQGSRTQATFTDVEDGIKMSLDVHYSTGEVNITPGSEDTVAPSADAGSDASTSLSTSVTLDGSSSTDDVGIASYEWDVDGDGTYDLTGESPSHSFASTGDQTVTLRVTDGSGNTDTDVVSVSVSDTTAPTADAGSDTSASVGDTVTLDASSSSDNDAIATYEWDVDGDGTYEETGATVDHTYDSSGSYTATVRVTDDAGNTDTASVAIDVTSDDSGGDDTDDTAPTADAGTESTVTADETVTFDGSGSVDNVGVTTYEWDVDGDGAYDLSGASVDHQFEDPGEYTVTLRVTDDAGNTATDTVVVTVEEPPSAEFDVTDRTLDRRDVVVGETVTASVTVANAGDAAGTYTVNLVVEGETLASKTVSLDAGAETDVALTFSPDAADEYAVELANESVGTVTAEAQTTTEPPETTTQAPETTTASSETTQPPQTTAATTTAPTETTAPAGTTTAAETTDASGTTAVTGTPDGEGQPGFEAVLTVLALLGAGLLARRRRD